MERQGWSLVARTARDAALQQQERAMRYARRLTLRALAGLLVHSVPLLGADSAAGRALYQQYSSVCHGAQGKGNDPAASTMPPKPRNHTDGQYMQSLSETHLTRVISEGGAAV